MAISDCHMIFDRLYEGVIQLDADRKITYWNLGAKRLTGFSAEETIGTLCHDDILNHIDAQGRMLCLEGGPLSQSMNDGKTREMAMYLQHKRGYRIPVRMRIVPIVEDEKVVGSMEIFIEITESNHEGIQTLNNHVLVDSLTHLPNQVMVERFIQLKFKENSELGIPFGIAIIDLDNFEAINRTYGNAIGDDVLNLLSESFKHCFQSADLIGRWENDAFIFVFTNISKDAFIKICDRIRVVSEGSVLRNTPFKDIDFSVSIGGSRVRRDDDFHTLINRVTEQLKKAKIRGGNNSVVK